MMFTVSETKCMKNTCNGNKLENKRAATEAGVNIIPVIVEVCVCYILMLCNCIALKLLN